MREAPRKVKPGAVPVAPENRVAELVASVKARGAEATRSGNAAEQPELLLDSQTPSIPPRAPARWAELAVAQDARRAAGDATWRIHDRTHLEFEVDYPVSPSAGENEHEWDAYFFVPDSFRLDRSNYEKNDIYDDLVSYVRLAVPRVALEDLVGEPLDRMRRALADATDTAGALRELRLYACVVRETTITARRTCERLLESEVGTGAAADAAVCFVNELGTVADRLRETIGPVQDGPEPLATAARFVDEDVSRVMELELAALAVSLRDVEESKAAKVVASAAVAEARYRDVRGLGEVSRRGLTPLEIEAQEYRRHLLKRFASSALWLRLEVRQAATWLLQLASAVAASVAMAFAVAAAFYQGVAPSDETLWRWAIIAVIAYAGKDRIKAALQGAFAKWLSRITPDRKWRVLDRDGAHELGSVLERSGFVSLDRLPPAAIAARRMTLRHALEEQARPEQILWHHKTVRIDGKAVRGLDERYEAFTEIFRLNVDRWLQNTDDPKRTFVFADPDDRRIYSAVARRVYHVSVVYRLRAKGDENAPWHRIRVVVSRKGIRRIEAIC
ncbi:MAG: hypothetical protein IT379_41200 [Deltaproteobacteria bacterium]|nr:hypothetical protein [Deltaproteobacteria bacterium]